MLKEEKRKSRPESSDLAKSVKARLVGGCLVITLPERIRREAGIVPNDVLVISLGDDRGDLRIHKRQKIHPLCDPISGECGGCGRHTTRFSPCECEACHLATETTRREHTRQVSE